MTYPASFIVMWVKGLFHSDWLGAVPAGSLICLQLGDGETEKSGITPLHYRCKPWTDFAGFLDSAQAKLSCDTTLPPGRSIALFFSRSKTNYFKLLISLLCVTYISKIR